MDKQNGTAQLSREERLLEAARRSDRFVGRAKAKIETATEPLTDADCHELLAMLSAAMWPLRSVLGEFDDE